MPKGLVAHEGITEAEQVRLNNKGLLPYPVEQ